MTATTRNRPAVPAAVEVVLDARVDPWCLFAAAPGDRAVLWREPDAHTVTVGIGAAAEITGHSPAVRFAQVAQRLAAHCADATTPARWFGGFSFDCDDTAPDPVWSEHPCAALVLPRFTYDIGADGSARCIVRDADPTDATTLTQRSAPPSACPDAPASDPEGGRAAYRALVTMALEEIASGRIDKVVLARRASRRGPADLAAALSDLARRQPSCALFAFRRGSRVFLGASPELLLSHDGEGNVASSALAGSRRRDADPDEDARLATELADDPKELAEHRFVVEDLRRQLAAAGVTLDEGGPVGVRRLEGIQHLHTPVRGQLDPGSGHIVEILGALHPSPAVCGTPTAAARRFIRSHENLDRGWYAGPVGWIDDRGAASFHVALRSGVVDLHEGVTHLFAGAGIVAGSQPERELAETDVKLAALGRSLAS